MNQMSKAFRLLILLSALILCASVCAHAAEKRDPLAIPVFTETDCEWKDGLLISETAHDPDGNPAVNSRGFHRAEYSYDDRGNLLSEEYFGLAGEPVNCAEGYAWRVLSYEGEDRHLLTEDRYAADGSRAEITGSYSFRRDVWKDGRIRSTEYFNAAGKPVQPTGGYARILYDVEEDENAVVITKRYLDAEDRPLTGTEGGSTVVYIYAKGQLAASNATVDTMGLGMKLPTDADRSKSESSGIKDLPMYMTGPDGSGQTENDKKQRLLSTEIFGTDGSKALGSDHWHRRINSYDDRGNLIRTDYYGTDGSFIHSSNGYASMINTYDDQNRVTEIDYLDREGFPVKMINGYARVTYEYYSGNRIHYIRYYGADGQRTMIANGYSMLEIEYDGEDFDSRETYYDILDAYTMCNSGYARIEFLFNGHWEEKDEDQRWVTNPEQIRQEKFFGTDLELIRNKAGYAGLVNEWNGNGQVSRTTYYDHNWEPVRNDELQYARIDYTYDNPAADAPPVYEAYFDQDGNPCEGITGTYARSMVYGGPKHNLLLEESFFDADGEKDTNVYNHAHRIVYGYDGAMHQTSLRYYDTEGNPSENRTGMAAMLREYTQNGNLLWEATFGADGNLAAVNGQAFGGISHSIGFALSEIYEDVAKHKNIAACGVPTILDIPDKIDAIHYERPDDYGPFGSSGASEAFQSSRHVAVLNAIYNACGVRIHEIPATPQKIKAGLDAIAKGEKPYAPDKYFLGMDLYEELQEIKDNPYPSGNDDYFNPLGSSKARFV